MMNNRIDYSAELRSKDVNLIEITSLCDYIKKIEEINEVNQSFDLYMSILKNFVAQIDECQDDGSFPQLIRNKGVFLYQTTFLMKEIENLVSSLYFFRGCLSDENIGTIQAWVDNSAKFCNGSKYFPAEEYKTVQEKLVNLKKRTEWESKLISPISFYYRGEASTDWPTLPSVMRKEEFFSRESFYFHEIQVQAPKEFENMTSFGKLVKMQHYNVPTRLLDITSNPLNALYFACDDDSAKNKDGKVILFPVLQGMTVYEDSDKALILSSIPHLNIFEQEKLMTEIVLYGKKLYDSKPINLCLNKLFLEICMEKPAFQPRIKFGDILNPLFVQPNMSNRRVANQRGAFLLCGLSSDLEEAKSKIKARMAKTSFIIPAKCKKGILNQLDSIGINKATIYPDIEKIADYLKRL